MDLLGVISCNRKQVGSRSAGCRGQNRSRCVVHSVLDGHVRITYFADGRALGRKSGRVEIRDSRFEVEKSEFMQCGRDRDTVSFRSTPDVDLDGDVVSQSNPATPVILKEGKERNLQIAATKQRYQAPKDSAHQMNVRV